MICSGVFKRAHAPAVACAAHTYLLVAIEKRGGALGAFDTVRRY